jgi:hypothetical protein
LILPALGVVSFPQQLIKNSDLPSSTSVPRPDGGPTGGWQPAQGGLPITTGFPNSPLPSSPTTAPSSFHSQSVASPSPAPPSLDPLALNDPALQLNSVGVEEHPSKVGTGLWLLLGPIWLASLGMWTIAPGPKTGKK